MSYSGLSLDESGNEGPLILFSSFYSAHHFLLVALADISNPKTRMPKFETFLFPGETTAPGNILFQLLTENLI
jgi:hypothetical protein